MSRLGTVIVFSLYLPAIYTLNIHSIYSGAGEAQRRDERQVVEGKKPTKAPEAQRLPNEIPLMIPEVLEEVPG